MMNRKYTIEQVDYAFGGVNNQVSDDFRLVLDRALSKIAAEIVDWATMNILFLSSNDDSFAFFMNRKDWKHFKGFVVFCESLKNNSEEEQAFTVAHELAHVKLGHRSPILARLSQEETDRQEEKADALAKEWLEGV